MRAALGVLACALAALVYLNALDGPFLFEDRHTVLLNAALTTPTNVPGVLRGGAAQPVVALSFAIDALGWGLTPFGFHVTNVALHIIVVGLFFGVCARALADATGKKERKSNASPWPAFVAASLLAVHPAMAGAVNYVSARSELLSAAAVLLALIAARRAILGMSVPSGVLAFAAGALALGCGASAAAVPLIVLGYDAWVLQDGGWRARARRIYLPALVGAIAVAWWLAGFETGSETARRGASVLAEPVIVAARYLSLLVTAGSASPILDTSPAGMTPLVLMVAAAAVAAIGSIAFWQRSQRPLFAVGVLWFGATVVAQSSLAPAAALTGGGIYVPAAGLLLASASLLTPLLQSSRTIRLVVVAAIVLLATVTHRGNATWLDPSRLWLDAVQRAPRSWIAHAELAAVYRESGLCERADEAFRRARELNAGVSWRTDTARCGGK